MHPRRLARLERVYVRTPVYFVTASTAARRAILNSPDVHEAFRQFADVGPEHGAWVGCYVLMPDHLHLFVVCDGERIALSAWMKSLKNALSKVLRQKAVASPHWQKGFFGHLLRSGESATQKWNYVRENPVRAGLVSRAEDWEFAGEIHRLHADGERF